MSSAIYSTEFYLAQKSGSQRSAEIILPIVFDLIKPASVVDIGCGVGTWLSASKQLGSSRILGFEGDWVKNSAPLVNEIEIKDLETEITSNERFSLALCMEVAEHLSESRSSSFVRDLTRLSDVVLFSAAVPGQGGTNHLNEQWQSYWAERFASHGYRPYDVIRPKLWGDQRVEYCYRQNALLYVSDEASYLVDKYPECTMVSIMHPELYENKHPYGFRRLLGELPSAAIRAFRTRIVG
jgi:hypothetical protein